MIQPIRDAVEAARKAYQAEQAQEAKEIGVEPEHLEGINRELAKYKERRSAVLCSNIMVTRADIETIASGQSKRTPAVDYLTKWAADLESRSICLLCGKHGIGKTFAAAIAIASAGQGTVVKSPDLGRLIRPTYYEMQAGWSKIDLRRPLIVLDDLGAEANPKDHRWAECFFQFCEQRALYGRTIITTNLRATQLKDRYDGRTVERLDGNACFVELSGPSLRQSVGLK